MVSKKMMSVTSEEKTVWEKILTWGLLIAITFSPLLYFQSRIASSVTSKQYFFIGCMSVLLAVWVWLQVYDSRFRLKLNSAKWLIPVGLWISSIGLSTIFSTNVPISLYSTIERGGGLVFNAYLFGLVLMIVSLVQVRGYEVVKKFFQGIVLAGFVVAITTYFTNFAFDIGSVWLNQSVGGGVLGNSTIAGAFLIFGFCASLVLILMDTSKTKKWMYALGGLVIILSPIFINIKGIFVTKTVTLGTLGSSPELIIGQARAAVGAIIVAGVISLLVYLGTVVKNKGVKGLMYALAVATIAAIVWIGGQVVTDGSSAQNIFKSYVGENRLLFWKEAAQGINNKPVFGWGPETFQSVHQKYFNPLLAGPGYGAEIWVDKPHNIFVDVTVAQGYVGLTAYIIFLSSVLGGIVYLLIKDTENIKVYAVLLGGVIAYIIQNQLAFDSVAPLIMLWTVAGVVIGLIIYRSNDDKSLVGVPNKLIQQKPTSTTYIAASIFTVVMAAAWLVGAYMPSRVMVRAKQIFDMPVNTRYQHYDKVFNAGGSYAINTSLGMMFYALSDNYLKQRDQIMQDPEFVEASLKELNTLIEIGSKLEKYSSKDYRFMLAMAIFTETRALFTGEINEAIYSEMENYALKAIDLSPTNPFGYLVYSKILLYKNDVEGARAMVSKAVELNPTIVEAHEQRITFESFYGTKSDLAKAVSDAQKNISGYEYVPR